MTTATTGRWTAAHGGSAALGAARIRAPRAGVARACFASRGACVGHHIRRIRLRLVPCAALVRTRITLRTIGAHDTRVSAVRRDGLAARQQTCQQRANDDMTRSKHSLTPSSRAWKLVRAYSRVKSELLEIAKGRAPTRREMCRSGAISTLRMRAAAIRSGRPGYRPAMLLTPTEHLSSLRWLDRTRCPPSSGPIRLSTRCMCRGRRPRAEGRQIVVSEANTGGASPTWPVLLKPHDCTEPSLSSTQLMTWSERLDIRKLFDSRHAELGEAGAACANRGLSAVVVSYDPKHCPGTTTSLAFAPFVAVNQEPARSDATTLRLSARPRAPRESLRRVPRRSAHARARSARRG